MNENFLKQLSIKNFKSIQDAQLDLGRVNLFIGPPGSGKSNFLESLKLMSDLPDKVRDLKSLIRMEDVGNLYFEQNLETSIAFQTERVQSNMILEDSRFKQVVSVRENDESVTEEWRYINYDGQIENGLSSNLSKRLYPLRYYEFLSAQKMINRASEYLEYPYGNNFIWFLINKKSIRESVKDFLKKFDLNLVLKPVENKLAFAKFENDIFIEYPFELLSDTVRRMLFYMVALETNENAILLLEEPEVHAFPYYSKYLGERIALQESNQFIITTHNPYLLFAVIEKCKKEDLRIFSVSMKNYKTRFHRFSDKDMKIAYEEGPDIFLNLEQLDD